jgi:hypothetical protein
VGSGQWAVVSKELFQNSVTELGRPDFSSSQQSVVDTVELKATA